MTYANPSALRVVVENVREAAGIEPVAGPLTEDAAALRFTELHGDRLRYCHTAARWYRWDGAIWRPDHKDVALHWARELARELSADEGGKGAIIGAKAAFAQSIERFARADPTHARTADDWDADPFLLGTPSGTVELQTGRHRAPNPADCITKAAAVAPSNVADCPTWDRFLREVTGGDVGVVQFLQQWAGYCLTGDTREHALVFAYGPGGNGKSVFLNVLSAILGDYAVNAAMDTFTASKNDRHSTELAMLRGARLVTASETEEGRAWAESKIKAVTGGDPITARFMRQDNFTFRPAFKLTIVGNHKPRLNTVDEAARRRFNIVPFTFKPPSPDRKLEEKLKAEWPAILRWMIDGCLDWQSRGLIRPAVISNATADYFADQDLVGQWLEDSCDAEPGNASKSEPTADLFMSWTNYARRAGEEPGTAKAFAAQMQLRGLTPYRTTHARLFRGVRLLDRMTHDAL